MRRGVRQSTSPDGAIDRRALVDRHAVVVRRSDPRSPLSVGNGEFAFTVDVTGMQTFPRAYPVGGHGDDGHGTLLGTLAHWGWHTAPGGDGHRLDDLLVPYETPRGAVAYVDAAETAGAWLRGNPHRLDLGRIGLEFRDGDGRTEQVELSDVADVHQVLDLWSGMIDSRFRVSDDVVRVRTVCHPERDVLAFRIDSPALRDGRLAVRMAFAYGSQKWHDAADWSSPGAHRTWVRRYGSGWRVGRELDDTTYDVTVGCDHAAGLAQVAEHRLRITTDREHLELVVGFARGGEPAVPTSWSYDDVAEATSKHWTGFWTGGGAVQLADSADERAGELERRIVLSQYLTAINCAGSTPPAETGLVCNSWQGRFHLGTHWWHTAHFALWGRPDLLERSLGWYHSAATAAGETARRQGYAGVRWPGLAGPDAREAPGANGAFLIWQQPHPIHLAELLYRATSQRRVLDAHAEVVFATAEFMADFAVPVAGRFQLGPPVVPAQESYEPSRSQASNPTFELAYWQWALDIAQLWRERLGLPRDVRWNAVARGLARPRVRGGVYAAVDVEPYTRRTGHPSMLCGLGFLPATPLIDPATMRATLHDVLADWDRPGTWGWDHAAIAMSAARLGEPELAVDALAMDVAANEYLPNGHNRQRSSLPVYLPGNGGLLAAVAVLAAGWDGAPDRPAPGFPADCGWVVEREGLVTSP